MGIGQNALKLFNYSILEFFLTKSEEKQQDFSFMLQILKIKHLNGLRHNKRYM